MKKLLAFVLAGVMCVGLACPAQATTYDETPDEIGIIETVTPREFNRQYEDYYVLNGDYVTVVEDPNWDIFDDRYITVSLSSNDGPTALNIVLYSKKDGASKWETISTGKINIEGTSASFTIKENYTFKIVAQATAGKNGYAKIQVVLK